MAHGISDGTADSADVLADLLHLAARTLAVGGRLVFLLPTDEGFCAAHLPPHPCLEVVALAGQRMKRYYARSCITMQKTEGYTEAARVGYLRPPPRAFEEATMLKGGGLKGDGLARRRQQKPPPPPPQQHLQQ
jgi:hypothetical protein